MTALLTTTVGSFPKPKYLVEARARFQRGEITAEELQRLERRATEEVIRLQEQIGLDILVHGEMERGDMVTYFAERFEGFGISGLVRSYGNRYYRKPIIEGTVRRPGPVALQAYLEAQALTSKPVKGMLTGPYTICDWSFNDYYPNRREAVLAIAQLVHEEAIALERAGCRYIQIDEPAISTRPDEIDLAIEAMAVVTDGLRAKTITHICYGRFETIYPRMLDIPVDQIDLEVSNNGFALLDLLATHPFHKEIGLGVVDVHSHLIESVDHVKKGIQKALSFIDPERIYVDPDCGLKTRTEEETRGKLEVLVTAVREARAELGLA